MKTEILVHYCDYSSQPHIRIACDQSWTTPSWKDPYPAGYKDIYRADDNRLYTFMPFKGYATCPACVAEIVKVHGELKPAPTPAEIEAAHVRLQALLARWRREKGTAA